MKILIVECTAEELRANRTVMDSLTEALSGFTRSLAGVDDARTDSGSTRKNGRKRRTGRGRRRCEHLKKF